MTKLKIALKVAHWLLAAVALALVVTGLGITEFRVVEAVTFNLLTKALSYQLHTILWIPFLVLLAFHIIASKYMKALFTGKRDGKYNRVPE
jgi:cytochrome b subunit of formate dehydrogenase